MTLSECCKIPRPDYQLDGQFQKSRSVYDTALLILLHNCTKVHTGAFICFDSIFSVAAYQNLVVSVSKRFFEKS